MIYLTWMKLIHIWLLMDKIQLFLIFVISCSMNGFTIRFLVGNFLRKGSSLAGYLILLNRKVLKWHNTSWIGKLSLFLEKLPMAFFLGYTSNSWVKETHENIWWCNLCQAWGLNNLKRNQGRRCELDSLWVQRINTLFILWWWWNSFWCVSFIEGLINSEVLLHQEDNKDGSIGPKVKAKVIGYLTDTNGDVIR